MVYVLCPRVEQAKNEFLEQLACVRCHKPVLLWHFNRHLTPLCHPCHAERGREKL